MDQTYRNFTDGSAIGNPGPGGWGIVGAVTELERSLIVERVRAGMRCVRFDGQRIGRAPLELDHAAIQLDRLHGQSLRQIGKGHRVSTATVQRVLKKQPAQVQSPLFDKTA